MIELTDREFAFLTNYMQRHYGIDLSKKRMLIQGRLNSTLVKHGLTNFTDYIKLVENDASGKDLHHMLNKLTTNLTYFVREPAHFEYIQKVLLPELDRAYPNRQLRLWSAGCATGEEPYSMAMTLLDYYGTGTTGLNKFVIFASDISNEALATAQKGVYSAEALADIPAGWQAKYFEKLNDDAYRVKPAIRKRVTFKHFNLMDKFRFAEPFEIIFCRNVMIYFDSNVKENLVANFYKWTAPGGLFCLSHSETIPRGQSKFDMVRPSTFRKKF